MGRHSKPDDDDRVVNDPDVDDELHELERDEYEGRHRAPEPDKK